MLRKAIVVVALALLIALMFSSFVLAAETTRTLPELHGAASPGGLRVLQRSEDAGRRIALTWEAMEGAFGYNVYRADAAQGPFENIGGKGADSMRDYPVFLDETVEPGKGYYYAVTGVDSELSESPMSGAVYAILAPSARAAAGAKSMTCSLTDQRIYFFEGSQLVNIVRCSTGLSNATPTGRFSILGHYGTNVGLGGAVCDYWMSFTSRHGMHAWPRGSRSNYETGLGAPASHGCIRLHPLEAYWPYNWAPNGTPLTITYASLARRVITGCHSSAGAKQPATDWYFAEGYTSEGYDTYLLLSNPGEGWVNAKVSFLKEGGAVVEQVCAIAPHSRFTLDVDGVPQMDAAAFSTHVDADGLIVAERAMYLSSGSRTDGTVTMGATELSTDWYFAEGYTADSFDTYMLIANPGDTEVNAWVHFFLEGGARADYIFLIAPHSRFTMPVDAFPVVGSASFSMHVEADGPVVAERAMYFNKGYTDGGHCSLGAAQPSKSWFFAEGCTRNFFESYILVGNPGDVDALFYIDYYLPDGAIKLQYTVGAHSRLTIPIASQGGMVHNDMAFSIYSDQPIVAERAVYYSLDSHKGGHATMGAPQSSTSWYFAEGYTDGAFDTYILISNPAFVDADVSVGFHRDDGSTFVQNYVVPAQRRVTVHVDELPGLDRATFSTMVNSDVPIMAERSMYFVMTRGY